MKRDIETDYGVRLGLNPQTPMERVRISDTRMRMICRTCKVEFLFYKGMKRVGPVGSGIGYCTEHNPKPEEKATKK